MAVPSFTAAVADKRMGSDPAPVAGRAKQAVAKLEVSSVSEITTPELPPKVVKIAGRNPLPPPQKTGVAIASGGVSGEPINPSPTNASTSVDPVSTPQSRIDAIAASFVGRMRSDDTSGMLDEVFAQRGANDPDFDKRLRQAIVTQLLDKNNGMPMIFGAAFVNPQTPVALREGVIKALTDNPELFRRRVLFDLPTGDQILFSAYTSNPGGRARPEDLAEVGIRGWGASVDVVKGIYAGLRAQYGDGTPEYDAAVRGLDEWAARYNGGRDSLDEVLRDSEFSSSDARRYMSARLGDEDTVGFYDASHQWFGHDGETMMKALMANINRTQQFAANYQQIADSSGQSTAQGVARLQADIGANTSGSEGTRALALIDMSKPPKERALDYVRETLKAYRAGDVSADTVQQAFRTFAPADGLVTPAEISVAMKAELEQARAIAVKERGGLTLTERIDGITTRGAIDTPQVAVAEIRSQLERARGNRNELLGVARKLELLSPEQRAAVQADLGANPFQAYMTLMNGKRRLRRATDRGLLDRLDSALAGKSESPAQVLTRAVSDWSTASGKDVLAAINGTVTLLRGAIPDDGAFDAALAALPPTERERLQGALALLDKPEDVGAFAQRLAEEAKTLAADEHRVGRLAGDVLASAATKAALAQLCIAADKARGVTDPNAPRYLEFVAQRDVFNRSLQRQTWDKMVGTLPHDLQRQIRSATALPASPRQVDEMIEHVRKLSADEQSGIAGWMGDQFGFSGPATRNALRELVRAAQNVKDVRSSDDPRLQELVLAQQSFVRILETQAGEREEIADNAQFYMTLAVGLATFGYGFSAVGIMKAALTVGGAAVASKYATLGTQHYVPEEALRDFVFNASLDAAGGGSFKLGGAAYSVVKPPVARFFKARVTD